MKKTAIVLGLFLVLALIAGCNEQEEEKEMEEVSMENIAGAWEGAIQVPNAPLPIIAEFGADQSTLSIPVQGLVNFPFDEVNYADPEIEFSLNLQGQNLQFKGTVKGDSITGTFTQQGQSFPFELTKGTKEQAKEEGERFDIEVAGGTLTVYADMPEGEGPFPAAIIIAGSGPTDKDGNSIAIPGKNDSLKMIGENLKESGIAGIRFDKRGVGENMVLAASEEELRFDDYIKDVEAIVEALQQDERFTEVTIIGHSEGSLVGMAAASRSEVNKVVSIAGAGRPIDEVLMEQLEAQLPPDMLAESEEILSQLKEGETVGTVRPELASIFRPSVQPYMISWLEYNPADIIATLEVPVLIVGGTHDLQVPVEDAERLHEANRASELLIIEGMNHVLKDAPANPEENMAAYTDPGLPLSDGLMESIIEFIIKE